MNVKDWCRYCRRSYARVHQCCKKYICQEYVYVPFTKHPSPETNANPHRIKRKTLQLAFMLLGFMTVVSLVDAWIGKGYLFAVVLTIIPFALLFSSVIKKRKQYIAVSVPHWKEETVSSPTICVYF
ncbi:hypothetical protein BSAF29S_03427 [Bacillus safensis subsp. safensis]